MRTKQIPLLTSCCSLYSLVIGLHRVPVKQSIAVIFGHNLCKCQPIFNILSLTDSRNTVYVYPWQKIPLLIQLLHYFVKCGSDILSTSLFPGQGPSTSSMGSRRRRKFIPHSLWPSNSRSISKAHRLCGGEFCKTAFKRIRSRTWKSCGSA